MNSARSLLNQTPAEWCRRNPPVELRLPEIQALGLQLLIKREDRLHPSLSGNKLYKLHGHLQRARKRQADLLVSFGGAWSNHLYALACAGQALGIATLGIVRGQRPARLSATLSDCARRGMQLVFVSRSDYRRQSDAAWVAQCLAGVTRARSPYVIPEGGGGAAGLQGCAALMPALRQQLGGLNDVTVCVACGTGTTLAGMLRHSLPHERLLGFAALKLGAGREAYREQIERWAGTAVEKTRWQLVDDFHCGGFAKTTPGLIDFMLDFERRTGVPLDPVYTGKLVFGVLQLARQGHWRADERILVVHSGGLQGRRGHPALLAPAEETVTGGGA